MKTTKISLASIQGKLTRVEMKNIMAGYVPPVDDGCVACGETCYLDKAKCCPGADCMEKGPEQGHICN